MSNNSIIRDSFEQILELGGSTAKQAVKAVAQSFNPLQKPSSENKSSNPLQNPGDKGKETVDKAKMNNHTPVDFQKLDDAYKKQDQISLEEQRKLLSPEQLQEQDEHRYFQRVKKEEEEAILKRKQEEEERKKQEAMEEQKKKQEQQAKAQQPVGDLPQGKVRKSILGGGRKKASSAPPPQEVKPSVGKQ